MSYPSPMTSRRYFVKKVVLASGAMALGVSMRSTACADKTPTIDFVKKLELHVAALPTESSGVVFEKRGVKYLIFNATRKNGDGKQVQGTALIELAGCSALAIVHPKSEAICQTRNWQRVADPHCIAAYELQNSSWIASLEQKYRPMVPLETHFVSMPIRSVSESGEVTLISKSISVTVPSTAYRRPSAEARHFAFTFLRTTFHCVTDELRIDFRPAPLGVVLASFGEETMQFRGRAV